jgi:hypothetical protein
MECSGVGSSVQKIRREEGRVTKTISKAQLAREMLEKAVFEWQKAPDKPEGMDFFIT